MNPRLSNAQNLMKTYVSLPGSSALLCVGSVLLFVLVCSAEMTNGPAARPSALAKGQGSASSVAEMMKVSVGLSDEQAKKLEPVLKEQQQKVSALRRDSSISRQERVARLREIQKATDDKIKAQLTPEQAEKWQKARLNHWQPAQEPSQGAARTNLFSTGPGAANGEQGLPKGQSDAAQPQPAQQAMPK